MRGETLEDMLKIKARKLGRRRALLELYREYYDGKLRLVDPKPPINILDYTLSPAYTLWMWTIILLVFSTLTTIWLSDTIWPLKYIRYVLGTIYTLFLPGYATIEALYPREEDLKPLEKLALSIGLSLAIVPLLGLILNYTPWGIRLEPVLATLALYITATTIIALYRKYNTYITKEKPKPKT
ncbi:MAG: DUF1616 domain-containing protein [Acidilobaceae archaeon]